ncbi:triacylglycerol lipase 2 [Monosporozyma unispora]|nr:hypothetical protein C6P44_005413 [Kazachstania unispora]
MGWFNWNKKQSKSSYPSLNSLAQNDKLINQFYNTYNHITVKGKYICSISSFNYKPPKNPVVLCHGLSGFDQLILIPSIRQLINLIQNYMQLIVDEENNNGISPFDNNNNNTNSTTLLAIDYWIGIKNLLESKGCKVFITKVPSFGSIELRALTLHNLLEELSLKNSQKNKTKFNLIAHSMGGLDARYLISRIPNKQNYEIISLTTISTPHHGSEMADFVVDQFESLKSILPTPSITQEGILPICFYQLSTNYMNEYFNHIVPNNPQVKYFSYGAMFTPNWYSVFKPSWQIIYDKSGGKPNDGMVTVESAHWGEYMGTLYGLDHLDIINWQNKLIVQPPKKDSTKNNSKINKMKVNLDILQFYLFITHNLAQRGF